MKRIGIILGVILITSCGPQPDMEMYEQSQNAPSVNVENMGRIQVTRIGVFGDDLAYGERRGVYLIEDNKTGKEFIGISGVGISETAMHHSGKTSVQDER